jgi:N-acetylmuramoyl-L-alanine amidase
MKYYLIIHCSDTPDERDVSAEDIHKWHREKGWDGIGYNKVVRRNGEWQDGRPDYWNGSHTKGFNAHSIGICMIGRDEFTDMQFQTLESLVRMYKAKYPGIEVCGHNEFDKNKTCPNFDVKAWHDTIHW